MPALVEVARTKTCTLRGGIPHAMPEVVEIEPAAVRVWEYPQARYVSTDVGFRDAQESQEA